jgi:hypothetical protein
MWQEVVGQAAADLVLPNASPDLDRIFDRKNSDMLRVPLDESGAFKRRLNQSGWFDEEIVAAGLPTQGKAQSLASMMTGWALVELARGRRCKWLPREFCVAAGATRVFALAMSPWSEAGGGEIPTDVVVKVKRGEVGSWSRGSLRIDADGHKLKGGVRGGTLDLGVEQFPVNWGTDSDAEELVGLLAQ